MSIRHGLLLLAALACAAGARAQVPEPLGAVKEVNGLVTMSLGSQVATVQPGTPVFDGARFVSSSSGTLELVVSGCTLKLVPNQLVQISGALSCNQQLAAIISLPGGSAAGGLFAARTALPLLGSAALAGAVARIPDPEITPRPR